MITRLNEFFDSRKEYGVIFIRIIIAWRLIYGTVDNIFDWNRMLEFREFLHQFHVAFPLVAAVVSVYAQFICGILYLLGLFTRPAAIVMIINFLAALYIAHLNTGFLQTFDALMMLFASIFFLFHGPGKLSVDQSLESRKKN
jgi:putative oxidoreductase